MGFFREADKVAGDILSDFRPGIIFIGRLLLLATFVEDGFRMWHQWEEHVNYVGKNWSLADDVAYFIILLNLVGQLLGSVFILFRVLVTPAGKRQIHLIKSRYVFSSLPICANNWPDGHLYNHIRAKVSPASYGNDGRLDDSTCRASRLINNGKSLFYKCLIRWSRPEKEEREVGTTCAD